jgi:hypothetical protein
MSYGRRRSYGNDRTRGYGRDGGMHACEDKNKIRLFLVGVSSLTINPLGEVITGQSSGGKSNLMNETLVYFPNVIDLTRMTEASPDRYEGNFNNKILKIGELHGIDKAQSKIRILISEGKLRLLTTSKDEHGNIVTGILETTGIPVFVSTTTSMHACMPLPKSLTGTCHD